MYRLVLFAFIFFCSSFLLSAQKSKVIGVFQLIENGKYEEAKGIIEDAIKRKRTANWSRTWYARGVLCQEAYRKGIEKKKKDLCKLYADQLYVALNSFKKARSLDKRGRYDKLLPPKYILLINDLMKLGETHFNNKEFDEAFRAFENSLKISKSSILSVKLDTTLLYNTALSAYSSKNWNEAIGYLSELNEYSYSSIIPHLMFTVYIKQADSIAAQKILLDGIKTYKDNEELILLHVDFSYRKNEIEKAVEFLNDAYKKDTSNYIYPYSLGLLYQKTEEYKKAIDAYKYALTLPSDSLRIFTGIGTCYFNVGAEMNERARTISNNYKYLKVKEKSVAAFNSAIKWLEKAYEIDSENRELISKLNLLYKTVDKKEEAKKLPSP